MTRTMPEGGACSGMAFFLAERPARELMLRFSQPARAVLKNMHSSASASASCALPSPPGVSFSESHRESDSLRKADAKLAAVAGLHSSPTGPGEGQAHRRGMQPGEPGSGGATCAAGVSSRYVVACA